MANSTDWSGPPDKHNVEIMVKYYRGYRDGGRGHGDSLEMAVNSTLNEMVLPKRYHSKWRKALADALKSQ